MVQTIKFSENNWGKVKVLRGGEDELGTFVDEFHFFELQRKLRLFLGFFARRNLFAHLARMRAVERFRKGFADGFGLEVRREHVGPRDGLQHGPMSARCAQQREDQENVAESFQHRGDFGRSMLDCQESRHAAIISGSSRCPRVP